MKAKLIKLFKIAIRIFKGAILALGGKLHVCGCKHKQKDDTEDKNEG